VGGIWRHEERDVIVKRHDEVSDIKPVIFVELAAPKEQVT